MLKIKAWLNRKSNAQFEPEFTSNGLHIYRATRLIDNQKFILGPILAEKNQLGVSYFRIEKFHSDLIHVQGVVITLNKNMPFTAKINSIEIVDNRITKINGMNLTGQ